MIAKYNFSNEVQDMILACKIRFPNEFTRFHKIFEPRFFSGLSAIETAFSLDEYEKKYHQSPGFKTLANKVFQRHALNNPEKAKETQDYVYKLAKVDTTELPYILDIVRDFARERAVLWAVNQVLAKQQEGKEVEGGIVKLFEDAVAVGRDELSIGISLKGDVQEVVDKVTSSTYGVRTGYPLFDEVWRNGWAPGWLIVPLAPPKGFKTAFCINLALNIAGPVTRGWVYYYANEISEELADLRALFNVSGQTNDDLFKNPGEFIKKCNEAMQTSGIEGDILFKHFPANSATIADIDTHATMVTQQSGHPPTAIVIDYAETTEAFGMEKDTPEHKRQAMVYTQAKALGEKHKCPVIMPDRTTKEAAEKDVPAPQDFQGAYRKAGIVDVSIAVCSTPAERLQNIMRYFVLLNRHGPQFLHFRGRIDPERMKMTVDEKLEYSPEMAESKKQHRRGRIPDAKPPPLPPELSEPDAQ